MGLWDDMMASYYGPDMPSWLQSLYGVTNQAERPTAWSAPDQVVNQPQGIARSVTDPNQFALHDPGIYGRPPPSLLDNRDQVIRPPGAEFVPTMPPSFFGNTYYGADNMRDQDVRDKRILNMQNYSVETGDPIFRDRDMNAVARPRSGWNSR
jgi:hypothetical protein